MLILNIVKENIKYSYPLNVNVPRIFKLIYESACYLLHSFTFHRVYIKLRKIYIQYLLNFIYTWYWLETIQILRYASLKVCIYTVQSAGIRCRPSIFWGRRLMFPVWHASTSPKFYVSNLLSLSCKPTLFLFSVHINYFDNFTFYSFTKLKFSPVTATVSSVVFLKNITNTFSISRYHLLS